MIKLGYKVVTNDYTEGAVYQKDAQKNIFKVYLVKDTTPGGDDKPDPEPTPDPTPTPDPEPTPTPDPEPTPEPDPEPTPDEKPTPAPDEDKPTPSTPDKDDKDKDDSSNKGDAGNKGNTDNGNTGDGNNKVDHEVVDNTSYDQVAESENTESTEEAPMVYAATVDENVPASEVDNDNGNTNTQEAKETLPQTGVQESKVGIFGLLLAAVGSLFGLAGTRKRKDK